MKTLPIYMVRYYEREKMEYPELTAESLALHGMREGFFTVEDSFYHGGLHALSQSRLKEYAKSPAHFKTAMENRNESYNPVFAEGKAWHMALLEPHKFSSMCSFEPHFDKRTKAGKQQHSEWLEANQGKLIVPEDTIATIVETVEMMRDDELLQPYITGGVAEIACMVKLKRYNDTWVKAKLDYWHPETNFILDLKTTQSIEDFGHSIQKYDYLVQAAFYSDLVESLTGKPVAGYGILAVEKKKPNAYKIFVPNEDSIQRGRNRYEKYMTIHLDCLANDNWPVYDTLVEHWQASSWYK